MGRSAILIRGPSGSGKSQLALELIEAGHKGQCRRARLVADDRVHLATAHGRLIAAVPEALHGKIEIRGLGIREMEYEPLALVSLVVDLAAEDASRMPEAAAHTTEISGVTLSRLPIAAGESALPSVLAMISTVMHL